MTAELPLSSKTPVKKHIFLSYASANRTDVERLHAQLQEQGLPVWIDNLSVTEGLRVGHPWQDGLADALQAAMAVVWVASPASIRSPWVRAELRRTLELGKALIPYVLDDSFTAETEWEEARTWTTLDGHALGDLQRIVPAVLGPAYNLPKLSGQLRQIVRGARISGPLFPSSVLDVPIRGRNTDLNAIEALLQEDRRLVVLMAMGGTGKTRLAAEIAVRQRHYVNGVVWHKIETHTREADLTAQIREHLDLDTETAPDAVWEALARMDVLIVLDNAEFCTDIPAYTRRLEHYSLAGGTRVLMASRVQWRETRRFNRAYELIAPDLDAAEQIARDMAEQQGYSDKLAGQERALAQAAHRHPRLIQYAMGWLYEFTPEQVMQMLRSLHGGEDMQEALDDILNRTLRQMAAQPGGEQALADLKRLLVCEGGFTAAAAEALLGPDYLTSLGLLRRWNLLQLNDGRYQPDALIEAALEADDAAHLAHFDHYLALAASHKERQDYVGLDIESANLQTAFEWAIQDREFKKALNLLTTMDSFLDNRGRFDLSLAWSELVSEALRDNPDRMLWARAQQQLADAYWAQPLGDRHNNVRKAITCYNHALKHQTPQSDKQAYAQSQSGLGLAYVDLAKVEERETNLREAIACYNRALEVRTPDATPLAYATTLNNLGNAYRSLGQIEDREENLSKAIACFTRALEFHTPQTAPLDYATTQNDLGNAYWDLAQIENREDNLRAAIDCYNRALDFHTPYTAPLAYATTQNNLGTAHANLAEFESPESNLNKAITCYQLALDFRTPQATPLDYAMTQNNLGLSYNELARINNRKSNLNEAISCYKLALEFYTTAAAPLSFAKVQNNLGNAYSDLATIENHETNLNEAIACYNRALEFRTLGDDPFGYAQTRNNLGDCYEMMGNWTAAIECWEVTLDILRQMGEEDFNTYFEEKIGKAQAQMDSSED